MKKIFFLLFLYLLSINYVSYGNYGTGLWYGKTSTAQRIGTSTAGDLDFSRSTHGLQGSFQTDIGVKWRQFIGGLNIDSAHVYAGADINGDGKQDLFYIKGGKGYLYDLTTGLLIWETKVFGMHTIVGVEGVLGNTKSKQIVFGFGDGPFYIGILNGRTGEMITNSMLWGTLGKSWTYAPNFIRDKQTDNSVIYTFSRWRSPLIGIKIHAEGNTVKIQPLYENRYKNTSGNIVNTSTDDYSGLVRKMKLNNKSYFLISDTSKAYIMDTTQKHPSSGGDDFSMANFHTFNITPGTSHGYSNSLYDFDGDGNDEYIMWGNENANYYQKTKLWVGGLYNGEIKNYWGISYPLGTSINKVIPVKNYSNPNEGMIAIKLNGTSVYKFYSVNGNTSSGYTTDINLGSNTDTSIVSFNEKLIFEYDTINYGDISGVFDNGVGEDYIVTLKSGIYYFFKYNGIDTFSQTPSIQITGSYTDFQNKNLSNYGIKFSSYEIKGGDINSNGKREIAIYEGGRFKHYEITGNQKQLISEVEYSISENSQYTSRTRQYTFDGKDIWTVRYNGTDNTIKVYKTNTSALQDNFSHLTQNFYFYSAGTTSPISIFNHNSKNYLHFGGAVFDATSARPNIPPAKIINISNDRHFIDVDKNGTTDLIESGKVYSLNSAFLKTLLYNDSGTIGDFDGDNILDRLRTYKDTDDFYKYEALSGQNGSNIFGPISTSHTSCGPTYFNSIIFSGETKDSLISSSSWCSHTSRLLNSDGVFRYVINHMHTIQLFDIDGDGQKDLFGQDNNYSRYHLQASKLTPSGVTTIFNTPIYTSLQGDIGGPVTSVNRTLSGNLNFVVKGLRGEIIGLNDLGQILFRSHYYDGEKYIGGEASIFESGGVPLDYADVLVADITGNGVNEIVAAGLDGWLYIIDINNGNILKKYNIGVGIQYMSLGDSDNDGFLSVLLSGQDGFVYRLTSSTLSGPEFVKDGLDSNFDIEILEEDNKASLNFSTVDGVEGYFVQLYNHTKKSPVFDWVNIGNINSACIRSSLIVDNNCISAGVPFNLTNRSVYEWRVQSYNSLVASSFSKSNGFIIAMPDGYHVPDEEYYDEDNNSIVSGPAPEGSYTNRKIKSSGDQLGIILNIDNSPVFGSGKLDIISTEDEYKVVLNSDKIIQGTGVVLSQIISNFNCKNILSSGNSKGDGFYIIDPIGKNPFEIYCDMTTDGGGWTLIAISHPSKNNFGKNINRASPFIDFYQNEVESINSLDNSENESGKVLKFEKRFNLLNNSNQTLIKGIKGTSQYHILEGGLNLGNRLMTSKERENSRFYWNSKTQSYINNNLWKTSLQSWGNNCGWIEYIPNLSNNNLITAQKNNFDYDWCLLDPPTEPIHLGWFIR